ncbi:cyclic nucleotide-binding domain-containing protein [Marinicella sp. S1101]|uniref:cyclic nucleotide-binding domain-containing protein n=1 Tax=Marinicella marina TaxID=2996016 RepID=UPI002260D87C|nr:cyclic nucleotide-binding domain-containing protein [Marinicella marina]MCX7553322.1 cyclic nucleotide-binding domain-containing protein [Marinicella marina]MDJ1139054.1 cyclic nucleotide-binding domain-containing protein [Marinicella marina]
MLNTNLNNNKKIEQKPTGYCGDCELCTKTVDNRRVRIQSNEIAAIEAIIDSHIMIEKNQTVYTAGNTFQNLYTVHSGMFKSVYLTQQGDERIVDVFIPGQIMGFDGIHDGKYKTTVKAVSSGSYCVIPFYPLQELSMKHRDIQNRLMKMMSEKIIQFEITHSEYNAQQKLVSFVKDVSELYYSRGFSAKQFPFQISQRDLANYLGLAEETLSRVFKKLKKNDVLALADHQITIIDMPKFLSVLD